MADHPVGDPRTEVLESLDRNGLGIESDRMVSSDHSGQAVAAISEVTQAGGVARISGVERGELVEPDALRSIGQVGAVGNERFDFGEERVDRCGPVFRCRRDTRRGATALHAEGGIGVGLRPGEILRPALQDLLGPASWPRRRLGALEIDRDERLGGLELVDPHRCGPYSSISIANSGQLSAASRAFSSSSAGTSPSTSRIA